MRRAEEGGSIALVDDATDLDRRIRELEQDFRRAGVPNLAEGYHATEDVFTRALPVLVIVFFLNMSAALRLEFSIAQNLVAFAVAVGVMAGAFGTLNVLRRRPFLSIPRKVGVPELAAFVVLPAIPPLVYRGQVGTALLTTAESLTVLLLVYLIVGFGLLPILRWTGRRFVQQLRASLALLVRALPLLLFFSLVTFFANEYWQMFGLAADSTFYGAVMLFAALTTLFLLVRLPGSVRDLERESDLAGVPLTRAQRGNVGLVIFVAQALQIAFVALAIWLFFMLFGALLVNTEIRLSWMGTTGRELFTLPFIGEKLQITQELVRTAAGVASFSALYYAVAQAVDSTYRDEFVTGLTDQLRETFVRRAEYLRLLGERARVGTAATRRAHGSP